MDDSKAAATAFLTSLLSKTLRITTSDTRLFVGEFKCTDADRNIILSRTYEYRFPSPPAPSTSPPTSSLSPPNPSLSSPASASAGTGAETETETEVASQERKVLLDMTSRYLGLVVVPGEFITKIEVEEFASQVKNGQSRYASAALGRVELADATERDGV